MRDADAARAEGHAHADAFEAGGDAACLLRAATAFREAYSLAVAWDERRDLDLAYICICLRRYYDATKQLWALDEAVVAGRAAVSTAADPDRAVGARIFLGVALLTKAETYDDPQALREAVMTLRQAAYPLIRGDADKGVAAHHLADALGRAYSQTKEVPLLAEAVDLGRFAIRTEHQLQLATALLLAGNLVQLGAVAGRAELFAEAASTARWRAEVERVRSPQTYCQLLYRLATTLSNIWHHTRHEPTLREALDIAEYAYSLAATPLDRSVISLQIGGLRESLHGMS